MLNGKWWINVYIYTVKMSIQRLITLSSDSSDVGFNCRGDKIMDRVKEMKKKEQETRGKQIQIQTQRKN